ncbi:hypothetical protein [Methanosarcina acetivorans]|uniref:Uncharacterized protein n=1 Tax=Methanosarcina acetivorans (strain ATCC 35395 / DSM 2834 / JCM 12185 / C2A) TaxID=188937 RepID=Q8TTN7_METAC|nr:hypothetical protein [Methanosarcina acetivorans]AAM03841.1 predicted protein [Methanosarcina acetivorans C2A]
MIRDTTYIRIIENYIDAYNNPYIGKMISDMHHGIKFENVSNGEIDLTTRPDNKWYYRVQESSREGKNIV